MIVARRFSKLMIQEGKVNPALRLLNSNSCGILPLHDETMQFLRQKHPFANPLNEIMILHGPIRMMEPIIYDTINADLIKKCALKTKGAAGPSGFDADFWRRIASSSIFGTVTDDLCHTIALMARTLCSHDIEDPINMLPLMACCLIPLDKSPGVRPIGIGEIIRRIITKAVMAVVKPDVLEATGCAQLCAGHEAGCEVTVHAVNDLYENVDTHGIIQIDASNTLNRINRKVLLHNIRIICPEASIFIRNCYKHQARLFIIGGQELLSQEGTTQ